MNRNDFDARAKAYASLLSGGPVPSELAARVFAATAARPEGER